ncbi:Uncharacterised protein [Clostridioides difficile]|uniref:hypothetical protein n=1 Tax=Clostridioides difficile TaxID=1496 RepID=UPI00093B1A5E|nr:hypothetical protein [Clostridioides difficile]VIN19632.1 Uncharacterised protein [Clostridioides difficile]HCQ6184481.1 hypothetical protein [Clostridioides difficile]HCQ6186031.1 hypothetical protein [Clostridioides difficile]
MYLKKVIVAGLCTLTCLLPLNVQAFEDTSLNTNDYNQTNDNDLFMIYIKGTGSNLSIRSGKAHISCYVDGKIGSLTSITARLQQKKSGKWVTISTWSSSGKTSSTLSREYRVSKGYSYRILTTIKAGNESRNITSNVTNY